MIISFIGMSGMGKSYWSQKLTQHGFHHLCIDDMIEDQLKPKLKKLGYTGIKGVAKWMGEPYQSQFKRKEQEYLDLEKQSMLSALKYIINNQNQDIVLDTTGSVIYLEQSITDQLKQTTTVINFQTPQTVLNHMFQQYIQEPKPVIWRNSYQPQKNKSHMDTLKSCYPQLLKFRNKRYQDHANITLNYHQIRHPQFSTTKLLKLIQTATQ